ncbi:MULTISPECIES: universal stress protein [Rhizobium]|uniref:universal stress protein n=1 Tax=Rhizobium TaxID=379 RepID=UPI001B32B4B1|nr:MULTISPECIES: universal stress protein [Rhizobium]MBX4908913.1 universal stress protein [Rhizobium bangladeshense]MBX5216046.1 universal stress protein [Rhizobium sp. NLR9a]MBX5222958.1 universal stress protein [Rhizobium sp. NLR8a]MBX5234425.1 universal stress protein [Rhizobium sp. NLR4a]MBX5246745.1 universal stress protein [Rhizobium sp. NLR3b]
MNTSPSNGRDAKTLPPAVISALRVHELTAHADVIALLPDPASARICLDIAEDAARAINGSMAAAHVGADPERMIAAPEEIDLQMLRDMDEGSPQQRLERVISVFESWKKVNPGRSDLLLDDCRGDLGRCVTSECHESALVVTPYHGNMDARDAFHDLLFNERKLVLVPPAGCYSGHLLQRVVIGWKPHDHARAAVVAARRWLAVAEHVTVLCVNDKPDGSYQFTARELIAQLGLKGDIVAIRSEGRPVAEAILDFAGSVGATCLLIGAFKHSYFLELLLGRVTRYLLSHARLPLMMKH